MLIKTLKFIFNHPFNADSRFEGLMRFVKWQINNKLNSYPVIYPFTENTNFLAWKGLTGATGNIYCGLVEFEDMSFLLHLLRKQDNFLDIGANVGVYTILASGEIGANTIAIEPVPNTFNILNDNILLNKMQDRVNSINIGLGSKKGIIKFTKSLDTENHVVIDNETDTIDVIIDKLDNIIERRIPILIKMDVEGFETEVLNGAEETLNNNDLKAIIIELNGSGKRYGYEESLIHLKFLNLGFKPFAYNPLNRKLTEISSYGSNNTIYIRDLKFVTERIKSARKIKIKHRLI